MSEAPPPAPTGLEPSPWERRITVASMLVTGSLVAAVLGTYVYGANTSPRHETTGVMTLDVPPAEVLDLLHDLGRRPDWRPDVARIARKSDPNDRREVWREMDHEDDRFDFEVVARDGQGLVLRTDAAEQIGYEATWTFRVEPAGQGARVTLTEAGFVDNPLFRGVFWLRGGPEETVRDELTWLGDALVDDPPGIDAITVVER